MKMKATDIGIVLFMYAVCGFFYKYATAFDAGSRTYPLFTITLLFGLTTLYLLQMLFQAKRNGVESGVATTFNGFMAIQFFVCLILVLVYLAMMFYLGFFASTIIFMLATLLFLRVPIIHTLIAIVAINLMVYLAFVLFLGVRLPAGLLF